MRLTFFPFKTPPFALDVSFLQASDFGQGKEIFRKHGSKMSKTGSKPVKINAFPCIISGLWPKSLAYGKDTSKRKVKLFEKICVKKIEILGENCTEKSRKFGQKQV